MPAGFGPDPVPVPGPGFEIGAEVAPGFGIADDCGAVVIIAPGDGAGVAQFFSRVLCTNPLVAEGDGHGDVVADVVGPVEVLGGVCA